MNKIVIFDLDGTLALIDKRRDISTKDNGKFDWGKFFDPKNIDLDDPNTPVIQMTKLLSSQYRIWILSGRSDVTHQATINWLAKHNVTYDHLVMRPQNHLYLPDNELKQIQSKDIGDETDPINILNLLTTEQIDEIKQKPYVYKLSSNGNLMKLYIFQTTLIFGKTFTHEAISSLKLRTFRKSNQFSKRFRNEAISP